MTAELPGYRCPRDATTSAATDPGWRCPRCGSPWDLDFAARPVDRDRLAQRPSSLWRYAEALPLADPAISFIEGRTPLVSLTDRLAVKLDFLMPTLSFKDRGAVMLLEAARRLAPQRVIADSSGNAGTSVAAYAARAGLAARIFVPAATSAKKLEQIRAHGAELVVVPGDREATAAAARRAADEPGSFYASHVFNPYFLHGTKTYGYELWEDLGGRLPEVLVLPVGNGTLVLGAALAVEELARHGLIEQRPRIVAVQSSAVAPLARAYAAGMAALPAGWATTADTVAEGIAIADPARASAILAAVAAADGDIVTVTDDQVRAAQRDLAGRGLYVEATAAACWAAVRHAERPGATPDRLGWQLLADRECVVPLCGAGLKTGLA